jgi:Bax protein
MSAFKIRFFPKGRKSWSLKRSLWIFICIAIAAALLLLLSKRVEREVLLVERVEVSDAADIVAIADSVVTPIAYTSIGVLNDLGMEERKLKFIDALLPSIMIVRHTLQHELSRVCELERQLQEEGLLSTGDSLFLRAKMEVFSADNIPELKRKLRPHPTSIALAQAALESGWGTSRIFREANNIFGIWSFNSEEKRIRTASARNGQAVYVRSYDTILESVEDYFRVLGRGSAYDDFRNRRSQTDNVFDLIWYLKKYSEKRTQYVVMLRNVIVANNLTRYDHYILDRDYLTHPIGEMSAAYRYREDEDR